MADTPCNSKVQCSLYSMKANKCSYARKGLQVAYQVLNVLVHVFATLITALCGCLFVGPAAVCVLKLIPPICVFPYNVYGKALSASISLWESVKSETMTCMNHGHPLI